MPLPLQKYLGWLSRYLYAVETGTIQVPLPTIDVANEPFVWRDLRGSAVTVIGNQTLDFTTPEGRRRLHVWGAISGAPAFTAGDDVQACLLRDGLTYPIFQADNVGVFTAGVPILGMEWFAPAATEEFMRGARPLVVGPGESLRIIVGSAAGGTTFNYRGLCIDVPAYAPFPNVF